MQEGKVTIKRLHEMKINGEKICMMSVYDYPMAMAAEEAGVDMVVIGDSVANAVLGHKNVLKLSVDESLHHCRAVTGACKRALTIADMPFGSYNESSEQAIRNATRFIKEGGVDAVLLEGGGEFVAEVTYALVKSGIPVMIVLGVNPQTIHLQSGLQVKGTNSREAFEILGEARRIQEAGAFAFELLFVAEELAKAITENVPIPTLGLGSGGFCDGQLVLSYDLLGMRPWFTAKYTKRYANLADDIRNAFALCVDEIKTKKFPKEDNCERMGDEEYGHFKALFTRTGDLQGTGD